MSERKELIKKAIYDAADRDLDGFKEKIADAVNSKMKEKVDAEVKDFGGKLFQPVENEEYDE